MNEQSQGKLPPLSKKTLIAAVAIIFSVFQLYTLATGILNPQVQRASHLLFALVLVYLCKPLKKGGAVGKAVDILLILCAVIPLVYLIAWNKTIMLRMFFVQKMPWYYYVLLVMLVVTLLEATRRTIGLALPIIAVLSLAYAYFGQYIPGSFGHSGFTSVELADQLMYTTEGIFGVPLGASATFVILFVIFGAFLEQSGTAEYFMALASKATLRSRGGPAKMAVFASGLFGSISGSAIANVVTTGNITIPLMKKSGYKKEFAGAVEAVASTGGQIMPPVMGAAVFIMSDFTGIPYINIIRYALLPAVLYYASVFFIVHFEALRTDIPLVEPEGLPSGKELLRGSYMLVPLVMIVVILAFGFSPTYACLASMAVVLLFSFFKKETRMTPKKIIAALIDGAKGTISVAMACGTAGIIVGVINYTGIGFKFTNWMLSVAGNSLFLVLLFTAVATMILGMGLPTTPAYVVVAALMVPTLRSVGVGLAAAHLFAFYFANIANITPPVALASYTAAGIAESEPLKTGFVAFKLGIVAYIVPFMFVYSPELLLMGESIPAMAWSSITALVGTYMLASGIQGWMKRRLPIVERILLCAAALCMIHPGLITDVIGIVVFVGVYAEQKLSLKKAAA